MTSIKVKFRPSATDGKEGSIYYQVIRNRAVRQISTELRLYENEWDKKASSVRIFAEISDIRKNYLQSVDERIRWDCKRLKAIIALLDRKEEYKAARMETPELPLFSQDTTPTHNTKYTHENIAD